MRSDSGLNVRHPGGMASTGARTLELLSALQQRRFWPGRALAERLGVSARTLRRDVDRLRSLGYPVQAVRGVDGGYQLAPGATLPPLLMDADEAVALAVAMTAAAQGAIAGIEESALRVLTKVVQVLPAALRREVDALRAVTVPAAWPAPGAAPPVVSASDLIAVAQGCRDAERLEFGYRARDGRRSQRQVEPYRLVPLGRRWYLVAYDLTRNDWRTFRLDRLSGPQRTGAHFRPRQLPAADAAQFVRAGIDHLVTGYKVEVRADAPAEQVERRLGRWCSVEPDGPRRCRVRMTSDSLDWAAMALGVLGAPFEVLSPPELPALLREWSDRFARAAG